jgi:murein L,D-transpeptidase YcbB/YkuD
LAVRLRELKDQAGITTATLARKTAYSRSSWTRCLDGTAVPPRNVLTTFGELAGMAPDDTELARLLALRELAERARNESRSTRAVEPATARPRSGFRSRLAVVVAAVVTVVVVVAAGVVTWRMIAMRSPAPAALVPVVHVGYSCDYVHRDGHWYAGHSTTSTQLVAFDYGGQNVVEVQCLLRHHGVDPGRVDGVFGNHTQQAVKRLQAAAGIVVDGMVGPQTWAVLRT